MALCQCFRGLTHHSSLPSFRPVAQGVGGTPNRQGPLLFNKIKFCLLSVFSERPCPPPSCPPPSSPQRSTFPQIRPSLEVLAMGFSFQTRSHRTLISCLGSPLKCVGPLMTIFLTNRRRAKVGGVGGWTVIRKHFKSA